MKTVNYQNGHVQFQIPKHWTEEKEGEKLHFYDAVSEDIFSLRFSIFTAKPPQGIQNVTVDDFMIASGISADYERIRIDEDHIIAKHEELDESEEPTLIWYFFEYARKKPDGNFELAVFSWSIDEKLEDDPLYVSYLNMVEELVKNVKFGN